MANIQSSVRRYVSRLAPSYQRNGALSDDISHIDTGVQPDPLSAPYVSTTTTAIPLSAAAVSLPSHGVFVDLLEMLPPALAARYATPNRAILKPPLQEPRAPRAFLVRSQADYCAVIRRMAALTMVTFTTSPKVVNGVFGTPKSDGSMRLVVDGRPTNQVFADSPKVELPTPDLLSRLHCAAGQELFVAKSDIDNFYHRIKVPTWMHEYFALPPVRARDVGQSAVFGPDTLIYPCCTTLPMGFSHSAFLGQAVHEHLLDTRTSLKKSDRITKTGDFGTGRTRHQVYIDDLNLFGLDRAEVARLQREYERACQEAGLPIKRSRCNRPQMASSVWGWRCTEWTSRWDLRPPNCTRSASVPRRYSR